MSGRAISGQVRGFLDSAFGFVRSQRETYETGTRFFKMRVWIVGVLALDLVLTLGFVFTSGRSLDVEVWFQPGFPANMLLVKNQTGSPLEDVTLVLDGRFKLQVERIERGPNGFEVNHQFRDAEDAAPPVNYRPSQLVLQTGRRSVVFPVAQQGAP